MIIASCGTTSVTTPTAPTTSIAPTTSPTTSAPATTAAPTSTNEPQYGGTYNLGIATEPTRWHPSWAITGDFQCLVYQHLWEGDWAKGPAGGYGTNETNWAEANNDLWDLKDGRIVQSWDWSVDDANDSGTIVYQIRQGVQFQNNSWSDAAKLVNGREVTADDVIYSLEQHLQKDGDAFVFRVSPDLKVAEITKTGPWEVTVKVVIILSVLVVDQVRRRGGCLSSRGG